MTEATHRHAIFAGLVYDEENALVETTYIGSEPHYIVEDDGFRRHVPAEVIDQQVVEWIQQQAMANKETVSRGVMSLMGKDDLFTKAMIESSLGRMDQLMEHGLPQDARTMLGMMGFKIVVNHHGEVVDLDMPAQEMPGGEEGWE